MDGATVGADIIAEAGATGAPAITADAGTTVGAAMQAMVATVMRAASGVVTHITERPVEEGSTQLPDFTVEAVAGSTVAVAADTGKTGVSGQAENGWQRSAASRFVLRREEFSC